jgi:hypothetical protein
MMETKAVVVEAALGAEIAAAREDIIIEVETTRAALVVAAISDVAAEATDMETIMVEMVATGDLTTETTSEGVAAVAVPLKMCALSLTGLCSNSRHFAIECPRWIGTSLNTSTISTKQTMRRSRPMFSMSST